MAALYSTVFIVIYALDECQAFDGCRSRFLAEVFSLQVKSRANLFATSRFDDIAERFKEKESLLLEIRASGKDVLKYLDDRIAYSELKILRDCRKEIKTEITKAVSRMCVLRLYL